MSVLDVLSGLSTAAGKGFQGYGEDRQIQVRDALARAKAAQEAERNRVLNLVGMAGINPDVQGRIAGAKAMAEVPAKVATVQQTAPVEIAAAVKKAEGIAPIEQHTHLANRQTDVANPLPTPASGTVLPGAEGKSPQLVVTGGNNPAHPLGSTIAVPDVTKRPPGPGGMSGSAQNMQARLLGAVSEGRLADERMSKFEQTHMKDGKLDIGILSDVGAGLNTGLAGSHGIPGIIAGRVAGGLMNRAGQGDVVQYQRDARLIARAEQLMSARGGSEAMASDNAFLAAGASNAPEATVVAAQKSRQALFGKLGAVIQALTPEQIQKLNIGLDALHKSDSTFDQKSPLEQTLDAIDKSGLANDIRNAVSGGVGAGNSITAAEAAALKAHGFTDAQIAAKYTIRP